MDKLFYPKSVAVVGVNREKGKVGRTIFENLKGKVKVYPVNPNAKKISGIKCYSSILKIKEEIDLAIIAVRAEIVPKVLEECGEKGIKYVIIISSGFSEVGNKKLSNEIKNIANKWGIRIVGPNTMGIISEGLNMTFFEGKLKNGKLAFISQSGALGSGVLDWLKEIKYFVSIGNQLDLSIADFIKYFQRRKVSAICIYIEGIKDGEKFYKVVKNSKVPIIILKAGRTSKGKKAAKTHTASISTDYSIWRGISKQMGAILVDSIEEMFRLAISMEKYGRIGKRALVITNAGGLGVLISDEISNFSKIVSLPEKVKKKLNKVLPKNWSHSNPIDVVGDANAKRYKDVLELISKEKFYDFVILGFTPQAMSEPEKTAKILLNYNIPIFPVFFGGKKIKRAVEILKKKFVVVEDPSELRFIRNLIN